MDKPTQDLSNFDLAATVQRRATRDLWINDAGAVTWAEFGTAVAAAKRACVEKGVGPGAVVQLPVAERLDMLAWIFALSATGAVVAPVRLTPQGTSILEPHLRVAWRVVDGQLERHDSGTPTPAAELLLAELGARRHPGLILATGGTTGTPKLVLHDLTTLWSTIPIKDGQPWRVLPLMRFDHIGGLDMAWRAIANGQVLIAPPRELTPNAVASTISRHRVEVMPATPSFLNLLLMSEVHRSWDLGSLRVVPFGAEPMPASLLERLRAAFPYVDFVQRFGTSETGSLPVRGVGNGLSLIAGKNGFQWKVVDGELWILSPARALGYLSGGAGGFAADGWFRTGDIAETQPNGSLRIHGRRSEFINVGGEKVLPEEVEDALLRHPLVADCQVLAEPNAILGQVVAAEVVWLGPEQNATTVKRELHQFAGAFIAREKLPAVVRLVKAVNTTAAMKKTRKALL